MAEAINELNIQKDINIIVNPCTVDGNNIVTKSGCTYKQTTIH